MVDFFSYRPISWVYLYLVEGSIKMHEYFIIVHFQLFFQS